MKAFISSTIILILMVAFILWNHRALIDRVDSLIPLCNAAKSSPAALVSLDEGWRDCREFISLSVYRDELERVERALVSAKSFAATSEPDYLAALDELEAALSHILESQELSLENIL